MILQQPPQTTFLTNPIAIIEQAKQEPTETSKLYTIKPGDTLTSIAKAHRTSVKRLWSANKQLDHPDLIEPSERLKIPDKDEKLKSRPFPATMNTDRSFRNTARTDKPSSNGGLSVSGGNSYSPGYCTWGVKNWVGWVRNGWGSAYSWVSRASAQGFTISSSPRVGDVASGSNHVAVVIGVGKGTVTIREMNYQRLYDVNTRTTPASQWTYIRP